MEWLSVNSIHPGKTHSHSNETGSSWTHLLFSLLHVHFAQLIVEAKLDEDADNTLRACRQHRTVHSDSHCEIDVSERSSAG